MIYIISEIFDVTTDYIMEWLVSYKKSFKRLNTENFTTLTYKLSSNDLEMKIQDYSLKKNDVLFNRRGKINSVTPIKIPNKKVYDFLNSEADSLVKSVELTLKEIEQYFGSFYKENQNFKITNLLYPKRAGFHIPNTIVTTQKKDLQEFYN